MRKHPLNVKNVIGTELAANAKLINFGEIIALNPVLIAQIKMIVVIFLENAIIQKIIAMII
jgi:hypothetical protein